MKHIDNVIQHSLEEGHPVQLGWSRQGGGYRVELRGADGTPLFDSARGELALVGEGPDQLTALTQLNSLCDPDRQPVRWAFWTYELFPYMLGGEVEGEADDRGAVKVKGYGAYRFKPFAYVEGPAGASLKSNLDTIREEYSTAQRELRTGFLERCMAELTRKGVRHPSQDRWEAGTV